MNKEKIIFWKDAVEKRNLLDILMKNEVLIVGTDTVYGFLGAPTVQAQEQLQRVKGVQRQKPLILLVGSIQKLSKFVDLELFSDSLHSMLTICWPGPVTIIFKAKNTVPAFLTSSSGTIAVRIPQHQGLLKLLKSFDGLFSTSANSTGKPTPQNFKEIELELIEQMPLVIKNDQELEHAVASTIIDCSAVQEGKEGKIKVVRVGAYVVNELETLYGQRFI